VWWFVSERALQLFSTVLGEHQKLLTVSESFLYKMTKRRKLTDRIVLFDNEHDNVREAAGLAAWTLDPSISFSDWQITILSTNDALSTPTQVSYHVHKVHLACGPRKCDYFEGLLRHDNTNMFAESKQQTSIIQLDANQVAAFPQFLNYVYGTSHYQFDADSVVGLYALGRYFGLASLCASALAFVRHDLRKNVQCASNEAVFYTHARALECDTVLDVLVQHCVKIVLEGKLDGSPEQGQVPLTQVMDLVFWARVCRELPTGLEDCSLSLCNFAIDNAYVQIAIELGYNPNELSTLLDFWDERRGEFSSRNLISERLSGFTASILDERFRTCGVDALLFWELTNASVLPQIWDRCAVTLLELESLFIPTTKAKCLPGLSCLQKRCIKSMKHGDGSWKENFMLRKDIKERLLRVPLNVVIELLF
jgi:hypothetical protein